MVINLEQIKNMCNLDELKYMDTAVDVSMMFLNFK